MRQRIFRGMAVTAAAIAAGVFAPMGASAQPDVGPLDADVRNGWVRMYLSGYPSGWSAHAWTDVPGGACGHVEFTGPNGYHWNSPHRCSPDATANGTGAGVVCANIWALQSNGQYISLGRPCANVY